MPSNAPVPQSAQCGAGYHVLCRAYRAGQCACRCHLEGR